MIQRNKLLGKMAERGYTQQRLAEELGMSKNTLSYKINGKGVFDTDDVKVICDKLNIIDPKEKVEIFLM